jgi:hypothetical protein
LTTKTVHGVTGTSYSPGTPLSEGTWYWTVIPVNQDDVAGYALEKGTASLWTIPSAVQFYSLKVVNPTLAFEDFKDGGAHFGPHYFSAAGTGTNTPFDLSYGSEMLSLSVANTSVGDAAYVFEYPTSGTTLTWNTGIHRYLQSWIPYAGEGHVTAIQAQIDGNPTWVGGGFGGRIDGLTSAFANTRPDLIDVNTLFSLSAGTHQLRFRIQVFNTIYAAPDQTTRLDMDMDWIKFGIPDGADLSTSHSVCGFVGPVDGAQTSTTTPVLSWTAPAGFTGSYIVSYSREPHFRRQTTQTIHGVTGTSYTPASALLPGTYYWTVIPVNGEDVSGYALEKTTTGFWTVPSAIVFYSFKVPGFTGAQNWAYFE